MNIQKLNIRANKLCNSIEQFNTEESRVFCKIAKKIIIRSFGNVHELVLLGMPCDSECLMDGAHYGYVKDVYTKSSRTLHLSRIHNMIARFHHDEYVLVNLEYALTIYFSSSRGRCM